MAFQATIFVETPSAIRGFSSGGPSIPHSSVDPASVGGFLVNDPTSVGEVCLQVHPLSSGGRSISESGVDPTSVCDRPCKVEVLSHGFPNQNYDVVKGPAAIIQVYFHSAAVPPEIDPLMSTPLTVRRELCGFLLATQLRLARFVFSFTRSRAEAGASSSPV